MLSRRNVRVKVFQALYAHNRGALDDLDSVQKFYSTLISNSYRCLLFNYSLLLGLVDHIADSVIRRTEKLVKTKELDEPGYWIAHNPISFFLRSNKHLLKEIGAHDVPIKFDNAQLHKVYTDFLKEDAFKTYSKIEVQTEDSHKDCLLAFYKFAIKHELSLELLEDFHAGWVDDKSLISSAVRRSFKYWPAEDDFLKHFQPDQESVMDLGMSVLTAFISKSTELDELILPVLKNWDLSRVAPVDFLLIKMALCELLYFKAIPAKVTINEYLEISKTYSTPKSKEFINGVLDGLLRGLKDDPSIIHKLKES